VLAKLFAEAIGNTDPSQLQAIDAVGGSRQLAVRFCILPQIIPVLLAQTLYSFESNTRSAGILGVVGAGGLGCRLPNASRFASGTKSRSLLSLFW